MFKDYYHLTKPGIIYGNAITAIAGFFLASRGRVHLGVFFAMLFGLSLAIACGCVINNYLDRHMDAHMERTKNRALVQGRISGRNALMFGAILGTVGFGLLICFTNAVTVTVTIVGMFVYLCLYTILKPRSRHAAFVGSFSGAVPPVVGYCSVTGRFDLAALTLLLILVLWQMPHFYAISIYRKDEYAAASVPLLSIQKGVPATKLRMLLYVVVFVPVSMMLSFLGYAGIFYAVVAGILGFWWLGLAIYGFRPGTNDARWSRKMFFVSLIVLMGLSIAMSFAGVLP